MNKRKLTRRGFLRYATLLGMSVATASQMAGLMPHGEASASSSRDSQKPRAQESQWAKPIRGGTLRVSSIVQKIAHPAQFSWILPANQMRQVAEYLTLIDGKNIARPYLLNNWEVSRDLRTWTLNLRRGIKFNNGDPFTADDVEFSIKQWLNRDVGSSMYSLMGQYLDRSGIEKTGDFQVKLHLKRPQIRIPEHLFHYPALVLNHRTFEGDFIKKPHGTGPYTLEKYMPGESCVLRRRQDYWQKDADNRSLPYMDGMEFIDMGSDPNSEIAAIEAGKIDMIDLADSGGMEVFKALSRVPNFNMTSVNTASTQVLRMRVDMKPWSDERVRRALKYCQDREKILSLAHFGEGLPGHDFHVYPLHPEYCKRDVPGYDPEQAKMLLKEAGYPRGLDVNLAVGNGWPNVVRYAEILKKDAAPAGFRININFMPTSQYWERWTEVDLGITPWMHRYSGLDALNLAYMADDRGKPVPWNETRWVDNEFSRLLNQANVTLDVEQRRKIFCDLEDIQMMRGSIGIAFWQNNWYATSSKVRNIKAHPYLFMLFNEVWLETKSPLTMPTPSGFKMFKLK